MGGAPGGDCKEVAMARMESVESTANADGVVFVVEVFVGGEC